jgi:hypothetical protein
VVRPPGRSARALADHGAVALDRREPKLVAEELTEEEPDDHRVRRDSDQHEYESGPVEQRSGVDSGEGSQWDRDRQPQYGSAEQEGNGDRDGSEHLRGHERRLAGRAEGERVAEVEMGKPPQEASVLHEKRVVDAELLVRDFELMFGGVLVRHQKSGRIGGDLEEDHERHECHRDDQEQGPQQATNDVGEQC